MFDKAFKRVNTFEDFKTELVKGKEKRAGTELEQEITKAKVTDTSSLVNHNAYMASSSAPQIAYAPMVQQLSEYSPPEAGLVLRTSSNPRQQATINNGRVTIQPIQGRQNFVSAGSSRPFTSGQGGAPSKQRVITCYNCKGKGHKSKQCTKPRRKRDAEWFKDKVLLVQAQANGQVLQEEKLEFLADLDNLAEVNNLEIRANSLTHQERQVQSTSERFSTLTHSNTKINLTLPTLQDDLILSVIEQLKTQVVTCTKINQDNKHVNDLLTAELERYKSQERVLNELKHDEKASASYEYSQEIESLKHTLSEYLKEKEYFEQKITTLKDDLQKEESRNIDRELALEKEALSFQNPRYLKKAQQLKPTMYDGSVIGKSKVIVVPDFENTLMHTEESRLKMIEKQNDPQMIEKKEITKPIDYPILN
nr:hypothetical protein [Tanacetum cinerariifolium]